MSDQNNRNNNQNKQNNKNPDEIEADIERTRTQLGDDVEAITYQLNPERYREQLKERTQGVQDAVSHGLTDAFDNAGERSRRAGQGFLERLEDDPLPVVLTVLGVSVLTIGGLLGGSKNSGSKRKIDLEYPSDRTNLYNSASGPDYGRTIGDAPNAGALSGDQDLPTEGVDEYSYRDTSSGSYGGGADSEDYRREAERQAYQTKRGLVRLVGDHPLITGSLITLVGVIAGLAVPGTRQEDELMGDASDQFKARAERATHEARDVAAKSYQSAKGTTKEEADKRLNEGREASRDTGSKVKVVAEKATQDAKDTAQDEAKKKR